MNNRLQQDAFMCFPPVKRGKWTMYVSIYMQRNILILANNWRDNQFCTRTFTNASDAAEFIETIEEHYGEY